MIRAVLKWLAFLLLIGIGVATVVLPEFSPDRPEKSAEKVGAENNSGPKSVE